MQSRFLIAVAALIVLSTSSVANDGDVGREQVVVMSVARFGVGATAIVNRDREARMAEVARQKNMTWQTATVTGHTNCVASMTYKQRLSERRAASGKKYLFDQGPMLSMVRATDKAAADPVAPGSDDVGRASNRRSDIRFRGILSPSK